jgi:hypothetical protein
MNDKIEKLKEAYEDALTDWHRAKSALTTAQTWMQICEQAKNNAQRKYADALKAELDQ